MTASSQRPAAEIQARVVPEVVAVRVPGRDFDVVLGGERWRCRVLRTDPPLFALTRRGDTSLETGKRGP